jgi:SH3 domain-binding protein 5 (SH3BP5)
MKLKIIEMEKDVSKAKSAYNEALQNLEKISDEIHKLREDQKLNYLPEDEASLQCGLFY